MKLWWLTLLQIDLYSCNSRSPDLRKCNDNKMWKTLVPRKLTYRAKALISCFDLAGNSVDKELSWTKWATSMFLVGDLQLIKSKLRRSNDKTCRTKSSIVSRGHFICMAFWRHINAQGVAELIADSLIEIWSENLYVRIIRLSYRLSMFHFGWKSINLI